MMQSYIIHTSDATATQQISKYIKYKFGVDAKTWKNIPTILYVTSDQQIEAGLTGKRGIVKIERNSSIRNQENRLYEIQTTDFAAVINGLLGAFDVEPFTTDEVTIKVILSDEQLKFINDNNTVAPFDTITSISLTSEFENVRTQPTEQTNWGLNRIHHKRPTRFGTIKSTKTGKGVNVFIMDSGILPTHAEFSGRIDPDFKYDAFRQIGDPYYSYPDNENVYTNGIDDHGTHVASIAVGLNVGVAFEANIIPVRILSTQYATGLVDLIGAVDWIINVHSIIAKPSVVNMSFIVDTPEISTTVEVLTKLMIDAGIILVASAGNQATDAFFISPSNAGSRRIVQSTSNGNYIETMFDPTVKPIVVGASGMIKSEIDTIWNGSNYGDVIDIYAPGEQIYAASVYAANQLPDFGKTTTYSVKTGTSMAAPFVTGVIALYLEADPSLTQEDIRRILIEDSTKNVFAIADTIKPRIDHDYYDATGNKIAVYNQNLNSPNRMLYLWHVLTNFVWPENIAIEMDESSFLTYTVDSYSTDYFGEYHPSVYQVSPIVDTIPLVTQTHTGFTLVSENGAFKTYNSPAEISITTPNLVDDTTATFVIEGTDNRKKSYKRFSVLVRNVPAPPVWVSPASGPILNYNIKKGDIINQMTFSFIVTQEDNLPITYSISPLSGAIPNGLKITQAGNIGYLEGIVGAIPPSTTTLYEFIVRATASNGLIAERYFSLTGEYVNEYHSFVDIWLSSLFDFDPITYPDVLALPAAGQGNSYATLIEIDNPDQDELFFTIHPIPEVIEIPGVFNGKLPTDLRIDASGRLRGIVDPSEELGDYYFILEVADVHGYTISQKFAIKVKEEVSTISDGDQIIWITPSGEIGRLYETYPSYCYVEARSPSGSPIVYSIAPGSGDLPAGLELDSQTGLIKGVAPLVDATLTYTFTIRAKSGSRYVDRVFSIRIVDIYDGVALMNVRANITGYQRIDIGQWTWANDSFNRNLIFRQSDQNFGLPKNQHLYIVNGLNTATDAQIMEYLDDYHHRMNLILGPLKTVSVYEQETNKHIYDVIYISVIDQMKKAGGFEDNVEQQLFELQTNPYDVNNYNEEQQLSQYYPNSLSNVREDLINDNGRNAPGLLNEEGLPLWMRTVGEYTPGIIIGYIKAGYGPTVLTALNKSGYNEKVAGTIFEVDRYYISTYDTGVTTQFDVVANEPTTHFDNPNIPAWNNEDFSMYAQATTFDEVTIEVGKYYKFPNDDKNILADRNNNLHR